MSDSIRSKIQELENEVRSSYSAKYVQGLSFTPLLSLMPLALPHTHTTALRTTPTGMLTLKEKALWNQCSTSGCLPS